MPKLASRKPDEAQGSSTLFAESIERTDSSCLEPPQCAIVQSEVPLLLTTLQPSEPTRCEFATKRGTTMLRRAARSRRASIVFPNR